MSRCGPTSYLFVACCASVRGKITRKLKLPILFLKIKAPAVLWALLSTRRGGGPRQLPRACQNTLCQNLHIRTLRFASAWPMQHTEKQHRGRGVCHEPNNKCERTEFATRKKYEKAGVNLCDRSAEMTILLSRCCPKVRKEF